MIPDPASTSQQRSPSSPPTKHKSPNTLISISKPTAIPYNVQNSNLWISGMRDPYIDVCKGGWVRFWDLISVLSLIVLDSTWRLMISYSSLGECREASVTREVSRRFHDPPPCRLTLPFVHSRPSHPIEGISEMKRTYCVYLGGMQCTLTMEQVRWSSFDQFWVVFHGELLGDDVISWPCYFRV